MILIICCSRKMTKGRTNRLFIFLVLLSLFSTITDLGMEITSNAAPLSQTGRIVCCVSTYAYLVLRNGNNLVLLLFLLSLTRTTFLIRKIWVRIVLVFPYACILVMLAQNPFTHNVFTVTAEKGYARGPLMLAFYGIALIYGLIGLGYCIYCRRYLPANKWIALLSVYILAHAAVLVQFLRPGLLLEMFCTAIGELLIMFSIMWPEERMDSEVGMLSWSSYQSDLRNILLSGEHVRIIVIQLMNCREIRNYLGDHNYNMYLSEIADGIRSIRWNRQQHIELYYERPGSMYLITETYDTESENIAERLLSEIGESTRHYAEQGICLEPQICTVRVPEDLKNAKDIISLGHRFPQIAGHRQKIYQASDIVSGQTFTIETHIEEILDRAVKDGNIQIYYQPIYDVRSGSFKSAEALARIIDPEYGLISPAVFIPAAEMLGYIVPVGDVVLEQVFRFISEHDLSVLGLSYIEINLSVAQCMESSLPDKIYALQQQYGVDPGQINLEITETTFENINEIMVANVEKLITMGYSFALDDYGIGYSSIQRINHIPLKLIKVDKSMLEEVSSPNGRIILEHTVHMMRSIGKQLVAEGAETSNEVDILKNMNCDYIQGFYFSRPLPQDDFIRFIEAQNRKSLKSQG